jgi:predicted transcriptional regulator
MRRLNIVIEGLDEGLERFKQACETGKDQGEFVSFESMEGLQRTLTPLRWELMRVLQAEGPMSLRALARAVKRDVKRVHEDVHKLKELGLIEDAEAGGIWVPYDEVRLELAARRAA